MRIEAAYILARAGDRKALDTLVAELDNASPEAAHQAARALQMLGEKSAPVESALRKALESMPATKFYAKNTLTTMLAARGE